MLEQHQDLNLHSLQHRSVHFHQNADETNEPAFNKNLTVSSLFAHVQRYQGNHQPQYSVDSDPPCLSEMQFMFFGFPKPDVTMKPSLPITSNFQHSHHSQLTSKLLPGLATCGSHQFCCSSGIPMLRNHHHEGATQDVEYTLPENSG